MIGVFNVLFNTPFDIVYGSFDNISCVPKSISVACIIPSTLRSNAAFLESSIIPTIIGVAITAIIASITITAKSSINVKPFFLFFIFFLLLLSPFYYCLNVLF